MLKCAVQRDTIGTQCFICGMRCLLSEGVNGMRAPKSDTATSNAESSTAALRKLAAALCRAQPALQSQGSPLLSGLRQGQQPDVGWTYVLPRTPNAACPQP